jgi:hypothetical protein
MSIGSRATARCRKAETTVAAPSPPSPMAIP